MKKTKLTRSQFATLYTPFFHLGAILLILSPIVLFTTSNSFLFWLYLLSGIALVVYKLIWAFIHRDLLKKLVEEKNECND